MGCGKGLGVQLDARGAHRARQGHRLGQRVHEQADTHPQPVQLGDQRRQLITVGGQVPAVV